MNQPPLPLLPLLPLLPPGSEATGSDRASCSSPAPARSSSARRGAMGSLCAPVLLPLLLGLGAGAGAGWRSVAAEAAAVPTDKKPAAAGATAAPAEAVSWKPLFDGKTLTGWKSTDFSGRGEVKIKEGQILLETGYMTGITWTNLADLPRSNYEISLEAMRVDGSDFFCGLTFPLGKDYCSYIVGGWGGGVVGLSSIDGQDASQNDTTKYLNFQNNRWFLVRLRVTDAKIEAWIDADKMVDVTREEKTFSLRLEVESSKPLGICTWNTGAALRNLKLRRL